MNSIEIIYQLSFSLVIQLISLKQLTWINQNNPIKENSI